MGGNEEESVLVASSKATRTVDFAHVQQTENNDEAAEGDNELIPSKGKTVIEVETEADKERRRRFLETTAKSRGLQAGLSNSQVSPPRGSGSYSISLRFLTSTSQAQQASFQYAANRIGKLLTTKLTPVQTTSGIRCQFAQDQILPSTIQELFILVKITPIDGVGGVLGQASPCLDDRQGFARVGYMEFDSADVAQMVSQNTFDAVVVHEMMHIIGIGTLWQSKGLVQGSADPRYHGEFGAEALGSINGEYMGTPAVQDTGGEGTALSHWRENVFEDEMMTGFLSATFQPISRMTIESFRDLGFSVDSSAADAYTVKRFDGLEFVPLSSTGGTSPPTFDSDGSDGSTVSIGLIVGVVVGGIIVLIILSSFLKCLTGCCSRPTPYRGSGVPVTKGSSFPSQFASQYPNQYPPHAPTGSYPNHPPPPPVYAATADGQYPMAQPVYYNNNSTTTAGQYPSYPSYGGQYPTATTSFPNMNGGRQMAVI